jgi:hypothetical protein
VEPLIVSEDLTPQTKLYRYISIEGFLSLIETRSVRVSLITTWDDQWEGILGKVPVIDGAGKRQIPGYSFYQLVYGMCWSRLEESDAMWRIYSPFRNGIQLSTSVDGFRSIRGFNCGCVSSVSYFGTVEELLKLAERQHLSPFVDALMKREAFRHEAEVRFLTHADFLDPKQPESAHASLPVDLAQFLEGITLDPRADDAWLSTLSMYCERAGLKIRPTKSMLYDPDPHAKIGIVRQYVPLKRAAAD